MSELPAGTPAIYYHGINFWIEIGSIIVFIIVGFSLIRKNEEDVEYFKKLKIGYGLFSVFFGMCRLFFVIAVWIPESYLFYTEMGYAWAGAGLLAIIIMTERYMIKKTRHVFTIFGTIFLSLLILGPLGIFQHDLELLLSDFASPILIGVVVLLYLYLAVATSGSIRKNALLIIAGIALMGSASIIDGASVVVSAANWFGNDPASLDFFYSIPPIMMIAGLIVYKFMQPGTTALVDFYTNKRICIVHKGVIKGKMFICSKCNAFYCIPCKDAIAQMENKCWNCGDILVKSLDVSLAIKTTDPLYQEFLKLKNNLKQKTNEDTIILLLKLGNGIMSFDEAGVLQAEIKKLIEKLIQEGLQDSEVNTKNEELLDDSISLFSDTTRDASFEGTVAGKEPMKNMKKLPG